MISPHHEEARKIAAIVRRQLKARGAIGAQDHSVRVLRRLELGPAAYLDLLHYAPGRVIGFHTRSAGGFRPGESYRQRLEGEIKRRGLEDRVIFAGPRPQAELRSITPTRCPMAGFLATG